MGDEGLLPDTRRALLHRLATAQAEGRAPGMVAGVVRGGEPRWFGGRGEVGGSPPDERVGFMIGSITKTFTAVLVMRRPGPGGSGRPGPPGPGLAAQFGDDFAKHPPGRRFHYSNPGYGVLGGLVERLRGQPWIEAVEAEILEPLGMSDTGLTPPRKHASGWAVHPWPTCCRPSR